MQDCWSWRKRSRSNSAGGEGAAVSTRGGDRRTPSASSVIGQRAPSNPDPQARPHKAACRLRASFPATPRVASPAERAARKERPPGRGPATEVLGRYTMEDRNRSYPRTLAIGVPVRPRRLGPPGSGPGPPASTRPEAKQVSRGDPAECSHIDRFGAESGTGAKRVFSADSDCVPGGRA